MHIALPETPPSGRWDSSTLQEAICRALTEAGDAPITVTLPPGIIICKETIRFTLPSQTNLTISGHPHGTTLQLDESRSHLSSTWGAREFNLLSIYDLAGTLTIQHIAFDGGSTRAGMGGYEPPPSPWDAIVLLVGTGNGSECHPETNNDRQGTVHVINCQFTRSESAGIVTQNLKKSVMSDCRGSQMDALWVVNWCDSFIGKNITGWGFLSDALYFVESKNGLLTNIDIKTARQGINIQGTSATEITHVQLTDCAEGITLYKSLASDNRSHNVIINETNTTGCALAYAIGGGTHHVSFSNCHNSELGTWFSYHDFLHTGIKDRSNIDTIRAALWVSDDIHDVTFSDVSWKISPEAPPGYELSDLASA